jgi:hypothetical protein
MNMTILQVAELHLDLFGQQEPVLLLEVPIPQGPELHLAVFGQQDPLLLLDVSTGASAVLVYITRA